MRLDPQVIHHLCLMVGWQDAVVATAVALCASGGDPDAQMPSGVDETVTYRGLFGVPVRRDDPENQMGMYDYRRNARHAFKLWVASGQEWGWHPLGVVATATETIDLCRSLLGLVYL